MKKITFLGHDYHIPGLGDINWFEPVNALLHAFIDIEQKLSKLAQDHPDIYQAYIGPRGTPNAAQVMSEMQDDLRKMAGGIDRPDALPVGDTATLVAQQPITPK